MSPHVAIPDDHEKVIVCNGSKDFKNFSTPREPAVLNLNLAEIVATPSCLFLPTDSLKLTNGLFAYVWSVLSTGMVPCT